MNTFVIKKVFVADQEIVANQVFETYHTSVFVDNLAVFWFSQ